MELREYFIKVVDTILMLVRQSLPLRVVHSIEGTIWNLLKKLTIIAVLWPGQ